MDTLPDCRRSSPGWWEDLDRCDGDLRRVMDSGCEGVSSHTRLARRFGPPALAVGVALAIRLPGLQSTGPFLDESDFVFIGMRLFRAPDTVWHWPTIGGSVALYPPLSYMVYGLGGLLAIRLLNVLFGCLTVLCVYAATGMLAKRWFPGSHPRQRRWSACAGACLFAAAAGPIYTSRHATYDALACLLLGAGFAAILAQLQARSRMPWWLGPLCVGLALATRYSASMALAPILAFQVVTALGGRGSCRAAGSRFTAQRLGRSLALPVFATLVFAWIPALFPGGLGLIRLRVENNVRMATSTSRVDFAGICQRAWETTGPLLAAGIAGLALLVIVAAFYREDDDTPRASEVLVLGLGGLAPLAIHAWFGHGMGILKDVTMMALFLAPLASLAGGWLVGAFGTEADVFEKWLAATAAAALLAWVAYHGTVEARGMESKWADVRPAMRIIETSALPGLRPGTVLSADSWSNPLALAVATEPRGYRVDVTAAWQPDALERMVDQLKSAVLLGRLPLPTRTAHRSVPQQERFLELRGFKYRGAWPNPASPGTEIRLYLRAVAG